MTKLKHLIHLIRKTINKNYQINSFVNQMIQTNYKPKDENKDNLIIEYIKKDINIHSISVHEMTLGNIVENNFIHFLDKYQLKKIEISKKQQHINNALLFCCLNDLPFYLKQIITLNPDLNMNQNEPLKSAIAMDHSTIATILIEKGADIHFDKEHCLRMSVTKNNEIIFNQLINYGANITKMNYQVINQSIKQENNSILTKLISILEKDIYNNIEIQHAFLYSVTQLNIFAFDLLISKNANFKFAGHSAIQSIIQSFIYNEHNSKDESHIYIINKLNLLYIKNQLNEHIEPINHLLNTIYKNDPNLLLKKQTKIDLLIELFKNYGFNLNSL